MSLSPREQRVLAAIEDRLTGAAPELNSRLAMFTRLTSGEEMPRREEIRASSRWPGSRPQLCQPEPGRPAARLLGRQAGRRRAMLLLWLSAAVAMTGIALALNTVAGPGRCIQPWLMVCAGQVLTPRGRPAHPASSTAAHQTAHQAGRQDARLRPARAG